jgi:O-acetyl-ADP-ribose deacetylase (regulator of RNase III)
MSGLVDAALKPGGGGGGVAAKIFDEGLLWGL